jgi:signal peptidase I
MRSLTKFLAWVLGTVGLVCLVLYYTAFDTWTVPADDPQLTASIVPALAPGDQVLITRATSVAPGALVRCTDPDAPGRFVIGRVVSKTGQQVKFHAGMITVDGKTLPAPFRCEQPTVTVRHPSTGEDTPIECYSEDLGGAFHDVLRMSIVEKDYDVAVEGGTVVLASDNRPIHLDSRDFGLVQAATCQRIAFRLWNADGSKRFNLIW